MSLVLHMTNCRQNLLIRPLFYTLLKTISIFSATADHKLHSYYTDFNCIIIIIIIIIIIG
jgi:hypothetical protein